MLLDTNPKVLVVVVSKNSFGGVGAFNKMLFKYSSFRLNKFQLRSGLSKSAPTKLFNLIFDYIHFTWILLTKKIDIVHLNPSLGINAIYRDGIFILIAKTFKKKVYIHWHGWNPNNEYLLTGKYIKFIKKTIFQADHIKFLSINFEQKFLKLGFQNKTTIGTTFIDDALLDNTSKEKIYSKDITLLFLSTISKNKGIYIAIHAFKRLQTLHSNLKFIVAGTGNELKKVKNLIKDENLKNITFTDFISGAEKIKILLKSDIYIFPSYYEGMPTSLLEALGFGLPVVCSNVGAIPEIFHQGKMGYMIESKKVDDYVNYINKLYNDIDLRKKISIYNKSYASKKFKASIVIKNIDTDYQNLISQF